MNSRNLNKCVSCVPGVPGNVSGMKTAQTRATPMFAASVPGVPAPIRAGAPAHMCAPMRRRGRACTPAQAAHPAQAVRVNAFRRAGPVPGVSYPAQAFFTRARSFFHHCFPKWKVEGVH